MYTSEMTSWNAKEALSRMSRLTRRRARMAEVSGMSRLRIGGGGSSRSSSGLSSGMTRLKAICCFNSLGSDCRDGGMVTAVIVLHIMD